MLFSGIGVHFRFMGAVRCLTVVLGCSGCICRAVEGCLLVVWECTGDTWRADEC